MDGVKHPVSSGQRRIIFSVTEIKPIKPIFIYRRAQEGERGKLLELQMEDWGVYGFQLIFNQNHKALGSDFKAKKKKYKT